MLILCFVEVKKARVLQFPADNSSPWKPRIPNPVKTFEREKTEKEPPICVFNKLAWYQNFGTEGVAT
jgi:hypothetical protein